MKRIMILGAGGMLGHKLCERFGAVENYEVVGTARGPAEQYRRFDAVFGRTRILGGIDVLDEALLARTIESVRPAAIVNCVGIVKQLDQARNRALSVAINTCLPHRLARLAARVGGRLIHVSTDCVFDGTRGGYTEDDDSDATDLYGKSKYLGETGAEETSAVTLRTSIIGRELQRPTHGLVEWFLSQAGGRVRGYSGAIYTGFTTLALARVIRLVIDEHPDLHGTYHVASAPISKYILLQLIRKNFGLEIVIEQDREFECDRSLRMKKFSEITGYRAPAWDEMIPELSNDPTPYATWNGD